MFQNHTIPWKHNRYNNRKSCSFLISSVCILPAVFTPLQLLTWLSLSSLTADFSKLSPASSGSRMQESHPTAHRQEWGAAVIWNTRCMSCPSTDQCRNIILTKIPARSKASARIQMVTLQKFQNVLPVYRVALQSWTQRRWVHNAMPKKFKNPSISKKILLFPENTRIHM